MGRGRGASGAGAAAPDHGVRGATDGPRSMLPPARRRVTQLRSSRPGRGPAEAATLADAGKVLYPQEFLRSSIPPRRRHTSRPEAATCRRRLSLSVRRSSCGAQSLHGGGAKGAGAEPHPKNLTGIPSSTTKGKPCNYRVGGDGGAGGSPPAVPEALPSSFSGRRAGGARAHLPRPGQGTAFPSGDFQVGPAGWGLTMPGRLQNPSCLPPQKGEFSPPRQARPWLWRGGAPTARTPGRVVEGFGLPAPLRGSESLASGRPEPEGPGNRR
jgi:hypothetical protein